MMTKALYMSLGLILISFNLMAATEHKVHVGSLAPQQLLAQYQGFLQEYQRYQLTTDEINALHAISGDITIKVFFGTWCHDSQREVPRLLKYLPENNKLKVELYGLDISKQDPQQLANLF